MQNKFTKDDIQYRVGGLLYTPALNDGIIAKIVNHELKNLTSLALCLEDSISDDSLEKAEEQLKNTLTTLSKCFHCTRRNLDGIIEKCIDICYNRILHLQDGNFLMLRMQSGKVNSWI